MQHALHPDVLKRLKAAHGHVASTIAMVEQDRPGLDSAQQLHGITNAKREIKALASICEADRSC